METIPLTEAIALESLELCDYYWSLLNHVQEELDGKPPKELLVYSREIRSELNSRELPSVYLGVDLKGYSWSAYRMIFDL